MRKNAKFEFLKSSFTCKNCVLIPHFYLFLFNSVQESKKILEINPHHPVIKELLERVKE